MKTYRTFVVPFDFSSHARAALDTAHDLARQLGADLHLLNVVEPPSAVYGYPGITPVPPPPIALDLHEVKQATLEALGEVAAGLDPLPGKLAVHVVQGAQLADAICKFAGDHGADLLVMGTHGRTGLTRVLLGSVAERTLRGAPCPVLTVHAEGDERVHAEGDESLAQEAPATSSSSRRSST